MSLCRALPVCLTLCVAPLAFAQTDPPAPVPEVGVETTFDMPVAPQNPAAPTPSPPKAGEVQVDPVSKVALRGLPWRMANYMKGERVISIGWGDYRPDVDWTDEAFKRNRTTLERAQMIAAKQSAKDVDLIPFKVGSALVIAPEVGEFVNPDLNKLDRFTASSRSALIAEALAALTPEQMKQLGSSGGLAVASLSRDVQAAVARAFRAPLKVVQITPSVYTAENGLKHNATQQEDKGSLESDLDWSRARIKANLRTQGANVDMGGVGAYLGGNVGDTLALADSDVNYAPWQDRSMELPVYVTEPNTFKPSDLEGKRYPQPLGLSGTWYVKDVLKRLSTATGLQLKSAPMYEDEPVYLGSPSITAGETIDALRLGLMGAFRKLGDTYVFTWDRLGLGAIQQVAHDATFAIGKDLRKRARQLDQDKYLLTVAEALPFAADDPLALSDDQRAKAYSSPPDGKSSWEYGQIPWEEMTPAQQAFLKKQSESESVNTRNGMDGQPGVERPFTEDDLRKATLTGAARVEVSVLTPDYGWLRAPDSWNLPSVSPWQIHAIRDRGSAAKDRFMEGMPQAMRDALEHPKPQALPSDVRVAMVPPLSAARLNTLAGELKRHGFTTLLYPALYGGYATFETPAFPMHPSLKGEDGFAAAVAAMKPVGIQVGAYVNVLTWQQEGDNVHWLTKHPGWMDVDVTGTPRLKWLADHPGTGVGADIFGEYRANYVRATEPMVEARLKMLLSDLAKRSDAGIVAFSQWSLSVSNNGPMGLRVIPRLGFSLPDRILSFKSTGVDPVDRVSWDDYVPQSLRNRGIRVEGSANDVKDDTHIALLGRLIQHARTARKDWKVWAFDEGAEGGGGAGADSLVPNPKDPSRPDLRVGSALAMGPGAGSSGVMFPITNDNLFTVLSEASDGPEEDIPDALRNLTPMGLFTLFRAEMQVESKSKPPAFILDFRSAPNQITPSLEWISAK
ncbi:MAG TPA: hypothetical protein VGM37_04405 [Armatimonadota bacterium]